MTDATGKSFLSYRRTRAKEARLLIEAQHDVGIPTWQDLIDLDETHTDTELHAVLGDPTTANAIAWLTPDVATSETIVRTELPGIVQRIDRKDGFFLLPVAAGGLDYSDVARVVGTYIGMHNLGQWNVRKVKADPIEYEDAAFIAKRVLKRRITSVHRQLPPNEPIRLQIHTRKKPPFTPGVALTLDWTDRFEGREARMGCWARYLLPALEMVAQACERYAPTRRIVAEGFCALPAAVALGTTFIATRGLSIAWNQVNPNGTTQVWSLGATDEPSGFFGDTRLGAVSGNDIAVLVSVTSNVEPAIGASSPHLPPFRGHVVVAPNGPYPQNLTTPGQAVNLVNIVIETFRLAQRVWQARGIVHLFLAVPAGVAMMIGQRLNSVGPVQTYEHIATDTVGIYRPAALLTPSA